MAKNARPGIRIGQSAALTIFLLTAIVLFSLAITALARGDLTPSRVALVVSTLAAAVACLAMLADGFDLWMLGRRQSEFSVRMTHSLVFVSVLVAFVLSIFGRNTLLFVTMAPALIAYLYAVLRPAQQGAGTRPAASRGSAPRSGGRQRRGGRKRKAVTGRDVHPPRA